MTHTMSGSDLKWYCKYPSCNSSYNYKAISNKKFHTIPKDPEISRYWKLLCNVDPNTAIQNKYFKICEDHFSDSDYNNCNKTRLKHNALPKPFPRQACLSEFPVVNSSPIPTCTNEGFQDHCHLCMKITLTRTMASVRDFSDIINSLAGRKIVSSELVERACPACFRKLSLVIQFRTEILMAHFNFQSNEYVGYSSESDKLKGLSSSELREEFHDHNWECKVKDELIVEETKLLYPEQEGITDSINIDSYMNDAEPNCGNWIDVDSRISHGSRTEQMHNDGDSFQNRAGTAGIPKETNEHKVDEDVTDITYFNSNLYYTDSDFYWSDGESVSYEIKDNGIRKDMNDNTSGIAVDYRQYKEADAIMNDHCREDEEHIPRKKICPICGEVIKFYNSHLATVHREDTTECPVCKKKLRWIDFKRHLLSHKRNQHLCHICGKTSKNLSLHLKHHGEKKFKCTQCDRSFYTNESIRRHMRSHFKEMPYVCTYCSRGFTLRWNLIRHLLTHTNSFPYKCKICAAAFRHNVSLKRHIVANHTAQEMNKALNINLV